MSLRAEQPLAFALGCLVGALVADLLMVGADVLGFALHWRAQGRA